MNPRNQTFITIHDLTPEAKILFASDSLLDILGYQPDEVRGRSAFDYFHPEEVPFAHSVHSRGVLLDKAAVLHYARILSRSGQWISCECCFTIVHNVLVASTSIYFKSERSKRRARDAPQIRRIFSSSPRDPRYRMLEHLSPKFKMPPMEREPRAALILNRFTRDLTIMYATDAVVQILGVHSDELLGKPFYECIQPNCLDEAEKCLESAKTNESIAYLRFWYKDPRADPNDSVNEKEEDKAEMEDKDDDKSSSNDNAMDVEYHALKEKCIYIDEKTDPRVQTPDNGSGDEEQVPSGGSTTPRLGRHGLQAPRAVELEAVVSCTSDGLIVVLRRARPPIPDLQTQVMPAAFNYENGLFAAPWALHPIQPYISPDLLYTFRPPLLPQYMPLRECVKAAGGSPSEQLMRSIRDVAVFAWAVTGINPNLAYYGHGPRRIDAQPVNNLARWEPNNSPPSTYPPPEDLFVDRTSNLLKNPSTAATGPSSHYASGTLFHSCHTRHASLDEDMCDASSSSSSNQLANSPRAPSLFSSSTSELPYSNGYEQAYHNHHQHLCPVNFDDELHGHARHQQQQPRQQHGYIPASSSTTASSARRRNFRGEPWGTRHSVRKRDEALVMRHAGERTRSPRTRARLGSSPTIQNANYLIKQKAMYGEAVQET